MADADGSAFVGAEYYSTRCFSSTGFDLQWQRGTILIRYVATVGRIRWQPTGWHMVIGGNAANPSRPLAETVGSSEALEAYPFGKGFHYLEY